MPIVFCPNAVVWGDNYRRERMMRDFMTSGGGDMYTRLIPVPRADDYIH